METRPRIALVLPEPERLGRIALQAARELRDAPGVDIIVVGPAEAAARAPASSLRVAADPRRLAEDLAAARAGGACCLLAAERAGAAQAGRDWTEGGLLDGWVTLEAPAAGPRLRVRHGCWVLEPCPGLDPSARAAALADPALPARLRWGHALLRCLGSARPLVAFALEGASVEAACRAAGPAVRGPLPPAEAATSGAPLIAWTRDQAELSLALLGSGPETALTLDAPAAWPAEPDAAGVVLAVQRLAETAPARGELAAAREAARRPAVTIAPSARAELDRCPFCHRALDEAPDGGGARPGPPLRCSGCGTAHHRDCLDEHGRCTVLGCRATEALRLGVALPMASLGPEDPRERPFQALEGDAALGPRWLRVEAPIDDARALPRRQAVSIHLASSRTRRGEAVEGFVVVEAPRPLRVRGGALRLRAELTTRRLRGAPAPHTAPIVDRRAAFLGDGPASALGRLQDEVLALLAGKGGVTIPAGVRRYPFSFLLDPEHPPTVTNRHGEVEEAVRTELEVVLDIDSARSALEVLAG